MDIAIQAVSRVTIKVVAMLNTSFVKDVPVCRFEPFLKVRLVISPVVRASIVKSFSSHGSFVNVVA